jgi:hypothetical protein
VPQAEQSFHRDVLCSSRGTLTDITAGVPSNRDADFGRIKIPSLAKLVEGKYRARRVSMDNNQIHPSQKSRTQNF